MGRLKIISGILIVIMLLCAWSLLYTHKKTTSLVHLLAQSSEAVEKEAYQQATRLTQEALALWEPTGNILILFMNNEAIGQVDFQFIQLQVALSTQEKALALTLLDQLVFKVEHLYQDELPHLQNIF